MNALRKIKENSILTAALSTVYGVILFLRPGTNKRLLGYVVGAALLIIGLMYVIQYIQKDVVEEFYKKELVYGLCALILGGIVFIKVSVVTNLIPYVIGFMILVSGVVKIQYGFDLLRINVDKWKVVMILALINVLFGVIVIMQPKFLRKILFRLLGFGLVYSGVTSFVTMHFFNRGKKQKLNPKKAEIEARKKEKKQLAISEKDDIIL